MEDAYTRNNKSDAFNKTQDAEPNLDDPFELNIPVGNESASVKRSAEVLKDGIFERDTTIKLPSTLVEESKEESLRIKKEFKAAKTNKWVENFMKNNHYDIVETASNGDCYFDTIRIAFLQIGYKTTIEKLRAVVANNADESLFDFYKSQYRELGAQKDTVANEMKVLKKDTIDLKHRLATIAKSDANKNEIAAIQMQMTANKDRYNVLNEFKDLLGNFNFMQNIESLEDLREYMKTSAYWADERAIAVLEKELNFKTVVFAEYNYRAGDLNWILDDRKNYKKDRVFVCTTGEPIEPKFYILAEHSGRHYRLISYKQKYILTFSEIPYDVKIMIVIKCMESANSIYNRILAFRNFQAKLGVSVGEPGFNDDDDDYDDDDNGDDIEQTGGDGSAKYDPKIVLVYYYKSADGTEPGKGPHEKMPTEKYAEYAELFLKRNREWRKKLDDYWPAEFKLDGLQWYSVEHYYQASKFRKAHPEFYKSFSLSGNPDISRDVEMARLAGSKTGAFKETQLRPTNIKVDSDFYGGRYREEREKALYAKFSQNDDLKKVLLNTHDAKLAKYVPKRKLETDQILMKIRKLLRTG
jgi:hypothetical protein